MTDHHHHHHHHHSSRHGTNSWMSDNVQLPGLQTTDGTHRLRESGKEDTIKVVSISQSKDVDVHLDVLLVLFTHDKLESREG